MPPPSPATTDAYFEQIVNSLPQLVWCCTSDAQCEFVNQRWQDFVGATQAQLLGRGWLQGFHPDDAPRFVTSLQAGALSGDELQLTCRLSDHAGVYHWFEMRAVPRKDTNGAVIGWRGYGVERDTKIAHDITMEKTAERQIDHRTRELQRAHRELQEIIDAVPSLVGYWDKDVINRFSNRAYGQWFSRPVVTIVGRHMREVMGEKIYCDNLPYVRAVLRGEKQIFERSVPQEDGRIRHSVVHYVPHWEGETVAGFYALVHDITVLKQTEAALKSANHELEAFSYAVAHDLRAPLRAMIGFSETLQEECAGTLNDESQDALQEIIQASKRMGQLIDGLLALSRSTQGSITREHIDMSALVEAIRAEYERSDSGRKVHWEIEPGLAAWGDVRMVEMLLRNLIDNACKYTGRELQPRVRFGAESHDGERRFFVADNGAGFNMAHLNRLFKPFQRLHRQDEFVGIGIGLATVKRIAQRHGGDIEADSKPGQGATFYFTLGTSQHVIGAVHESAGIVG